MPRNVSEVAYSERSLRGFRCSTASHRSAYTLDMYPLEHSSCTAARGRPLQCEFRIGAGVRITLSSQAVPSTHPCRELTVLERMTSPTPAVQPSQAPYSHVLH